MSNDQKSIDRIVISETLHKGGVDPSSVWGKRIVDAYERGQFTQEDIYLAGEWTTCACGQQDPRIPRNENPEEANPHEPKDYELKRLGYEFYRAVRNHLIESAAYVLIQIEKRAALVLSDVLAG